MPRPEGHPRPDRLGILDEAVAALTQRKTRTALTCLGTVLGIAVLVSVLGLTATATSQIDSRFTALAATEVTITQADQDVSVRTLAFPDDFAQRAGQINGVERAGLTWNVSSQVASVSASALPGPPDPGVAQTPVMAATPEALQVARARMREGTVFNGFDQAHAAHVALVGPVVAADLGIGSLEAAPSIRIGGTSFTVIGVIASVTRHPELLSGVVIPAATSRTLWGDPTPADKPTGWVEVRRGAGQVVADQLAVAISPETPERFEVVPPPDPRHLRGMISGDLQGLFLILALVCLVVGMVGIANTTFVTVMERVGEIGLRRALGARRSQIAGQFLAEAAVIGLLGGFVGALLGTAAVVSVALLKHWSAVVPSGLIVAGPLLGAITAVVAATYPALRGARVEPLEALRS
ncbi:ABC transporter permease [Nocardioides sp. Iso805N]|uniref:ABC transporter permease n=1 Tax=Nocardioides sp. Iso805N TaxID=1283287 RepID=UPI00035DB9F6|nr:ABC transporter permease [Nocardioides sp. Iso805N]